MLLKKTYISLRICDVTELHSVVLESYVQDEYIWVHTPNGVVHCHTVVEVVLNVENVATHGG